MLISSIELLKILEAYREGKKTVSVELELGISRGEVRLEQDFFVLPDGAQIPYPKLREDDFCCYQVTSEGLQKIAYYADSRYYKLEPTKPKPVLKFSSTPMQKKEFVAMIEHTPLKGVVLDCGTNLGYTAIAAGRKAEKVITVELDANVLEIAKLNPFSQELFTNKKIESRVGDIQEIIHEFPDQFFDCIIWDLSVPKSSGGVYSRGMYLELFRVLKKGGILYHYVPKPGVKKGRSFLHEILPRLTGAGLTLREKNEDICYAICVK